MDEFNQNFNDEGVDNAEDMNNISEVNEPQFSSEETTNNNVVSEDIPVWNKVE